MSFTSPVDICNRGLQHVGARRIATLADNSKQAAEVNFCYDKLRRAELRRSVWRFATRRCTLKALTGTTKRFIPAAWTGTSTSYLAGTIVQDTSGVYWICMVSNTSTLLNGPGTVQLGQPFNWQQYFGPVVADAYSAGVTYNAGDVVYTAGSPDLYYLSASNANTANTPSSGAPWVVITSAIDQQILIPQPIQVTYNGIVQTAYALPYGFMRMAAQNPRSASTSTLATSANLPYLDWTLEGGYLMTATTAPIIFRYVADVQNVPEMDDMFCEGLAARIGYEVCETLTQSNVKLQAIAAAYQKFVKDARLINMLETGNTEPEEEEYELTRGPQGVTDSVPAVGQAMQQQGGGNGAP